MNILLKTKNIITYEKALEEELIKNVYVARYPQFNGAIGAAIIASERG